MESSKLHSFIVTIVLIYYFEPLELTSHPQLWLSLSYFSKSLKKTRVINTQVEICILKRTFHQYLVSFKN